MPLDYSKPSIIKFLKENYEQEKDQRVGWFLANKETLIKHATLTEKHKGYRVDDIRRAPIEICMPVVTVDHKTSAVNRRKKVPIDGPVLGVDKSKSITTNQLVPSRNPVMLPVEPTVSKILYEELPVGGRSQYLNARKRKIPDEKYYFCETSTNVISWQWKDSAFHRQPPKYGRRAVMMRECSRSGPQPDPKHYKQPDREDLCLK
ncbi:uncharacterized protein LOC114357289 [Ostrinia furnacalis]|uniref:uncharacterized protein LOC114357289 n=1 Tax=Ostrinia furnacalis TaxID=93504 RepID=UPI00103D5F99|nr:uncharacterized protein LOC114357289 [Ostrinia furnacalis]